MAILPSFYNQVDQDIYTGGEHYIPQENYRLNYTAPPSIANASTGITNTNVAKPYIWPPQGGGDGGGGGQDDSITNTYNVNQNLGPTNITDYESEAYGIGPTFQGSIARLQDLYSKLPTPTNLLRKGVMKWRENREIKKQEKAAIEQAGGTDGGSFKTGDKNYGFDNSGNFTGEGLGGSSGPSENYGFDDSGFTGEGFGSESTGNESTAADSGGWGDDYASERIAEGGRVGYNRGRVVNPGGYQGEEEENEFSIFSPKTWFPGGPESETNPTLFGTQNSLLNKASIAQLKNAIGIYQASGKLNQEQQLDYELKLKQLEALIAGSKGQAEGGLIGYFDGGIAGLL